MKKFGAYNNTLVILLTTFVILVSVASASAIKSVTRKTLHLKFTKIYEEYSRALQQVSEDMDGNIGCYYSTDGQHDFSNCDRFYKNFVSTMKVKRYCHGNALKGECIPQYKEYTRSNKCIGFTRGMMNVYDDAFVMPDGSSLVVFNIKKDERRPIFALDTNGFTTPNQAGEDMFSITIMRNDYGTYYFHPNITNCLHVEKGGIETLNDLYK